MSFEFTPDITPFLSDNQKVLIEHCTVLAIIEGGCDAEIHSVDFRYYNWENGKGMIIFHNKVEDKSYSSIEKFEDCALIGELEDGRICFSYLVYEDITGTVGFDFGFEDDDDWDENEDGEGPEYAL